MKRNKIGGGDKHVLHIVTAINRLSGLREQITIPCSLENAEKIYLKVLKTKRPKVYTYPRLEVFHKQLFK